MSQDGRAQVIPRDVEGEGAETFPCSLCGGPVYARGEGFSSCWHCHRSHCVRCRRPVRRFGKGWTCGRCLSHAEGPEL